MSDTTVYHASVPSWLERQQKPVLLIYYEPTESELRAFPFLQKLGGILTKFRHPFLVHFCDCYNVMKGCEKEVKRLVARNDDLLGELEANKENLRPDQEKNLRLRIENHLHFIKSCADQGRRCLDALQQLVGGKLDGIKLEDICEGGKFFNVSEEQLEKLSRK